MSLLLPRSTNPLNSSAHIELIGKCLSLNQFPKIQNICVTEIALEILKLWAL